MLHEVTQCPCVKWTHQVLALLPIPGGTAAGVQLRQGFLLLLHDKRSTTLKMTSKPQCYVKLVTGAEQDGL